MTSRLAVTGGATVGPFAAGAGAVRRVRLTSAGRGRRVLEKRDGDRDAVESIVVGRVLFEHRGDGDLGDVRRVL